jgi:hypothetical protein
MILSLPGWSWELRPDGVLTAPPEGKALGHIRYSERERPVRRPRDVAAALERDARFRIVKMGNPERLITDEGEYGALLTVDGLLLEAPVQHTLGFVYLDDFYSVVDGLALAREQQGRFAQTVRNLTFNDLHGLAELRRRRFFYQPPPGWNGIASFLHTYWFPHDYPRNRSSLTVVPAIPVPQGSKSFIDETAEQQAAQSPGFALDTKGAAMPHVTRGGLNGSYWEVVGRVKGTLCFRDLLILDDGRFAYTVILESPRDRRDENLRVMRALVDTIEAIPKSGGKVTEESKLSMGHWAE